MKWQVTHVSLYHDLFLNKTTIVRPYLFIFRVIVLGGISKSLLFRPEGDSLQVQRLEPHFPSTPSKGKILCRHSSSHWVGGSLKMAGYL